MPSKNAWAIDSLIAVMIRSALVLSASLLMVSACTRSDPVTRFDLLAFSTTVSLSVYDPPDTFVTDVLPLVEQRMRELEHRWRSFGDGELGRLNAALELGTCASVESSTHTLTKRALELRQQSNGLFDPTLGLDVHAWGFRDPELAPGPPAPAETGRIQLGPTSVCADRPVRLDLGGIAKGAIVAELGQLLRRHDVNNAIINIGGDMLVLGSRGSVPWRIAIQHPRQRGVITTFEAHSGEAVFSSGDYRRRRVINGQVAHHILDPRTGKPAKGAVATTVIHTDPLLADAAATALLVAGPDVFEKTAARLGLERAVLIDQSLRIHTLANTGIELPIQLEPTATPPP